MLGVGGNFFVTGMGCSIDLPLLELSQRVPGAHVGWPAPLFFWEATKVPVFQR